MRKWLSTMAVLFLLASPVYAHEGEEEFSAGIEVDGEEIVRINYHPTSIEDARKIGVGEDMTSKQREEFNTSDLFGKAGHLIAKKDIKIGDLDVPAGEYPCGTNLDSEMNVYFTVWMKDGDAEKPKKSRMTVSEMDRMGPTNLLMVFRPTADGKGSQLSLVHGRYVVEVPVGASGEAGSGSSEKGVLHYSTGVVVDDEEVLRVHHYATPYAEGKNFNDMKNAKMDAEHLAYFNKSDRFGKVGKIRAKRDAKLGDIEVKAGEYTCGLNADDKGNFSFVLWTGEGEGEKT
ncbi:MAG: hypothetical protein HUU16_18510, partial [Candidatus Omnitrophica bacterium]|nr:hypothetical protein [Candidatus Omnitrophota bacterium]